MEQKIIDLCPSSHHRRHSSHTPNYGLGSPISPVYSPQPLPTRKLVIVGDGSSGKTSLLTTFAKSSFSTDYSPTVFDTYTVPVCMAGKQGCEMVLWDTAGQEDYDRLRPLSYPDTDVVLVAFAVDHRASLKNVLDKWAPEVRHFLPGVPLVLVGLKIDLRETTRDKTLAISREEGEEVRQMIGADAYIECSAKAGINVNEVFLTAVKCMHQSWRGGKKGRGFNRIVEKMGRAFSCLPLPFGPPMGSKQVVD